MHGASAILKPYVKNTEVAFEELEEMEGFRLMTRREMFDYRATEEAGMRVHCATQKDFDKLES